MQPLRAALAFLAPALVACALVVFASTAADASAEPAKVGEGGVPIEAGAPAKAPKPGGILSIFSPPAQSLPNMRIEKTPPDPDPPMREEMQWVFDLRYERGDIYFVGVHPLDLGAPQTTPRVMGRFALELFEGPTLIERVRFDFPMLGAGDAQNKNFMAPPSLEKKLTTRIGVMFPQTKRGTRLELWDRATNQRYRLPWPPEPTPEHTSDAGADASN
jgi:hypothetical protein